jgi:hypothetical protein
MAKFIDFCSDRDVQEIMEAIQKRCPARFGSFDTSRIGYVTTKNKNAKEAIKLHRMTYPHTTWLSKAFIVEKYEPAWQRLDARERNRSVCRMMREMPMGDLDDSSKACGRIPQSPLT